MLIYMKKSETIFIFIAVLLLFSLSEVHSESTEKTKSADELYILCKNSYESGDLDKAGDYADMFLSLYTEDKHRAEVMLLKAFLQTSPDMAEDTYTSIIKDYPKSKFAAEAHFHLGQSYYLLDQYDKALDHYGEIIVSYTDSDSYWKARYWRCKVFVSQGDYKEAIYQLSSLKDSDPDDLNRDIILLSLANCYFITKDYEKAVENCRLIIDNMPDSHRLPHAYFLLSESLKKLDRSDEAKVIAEKLASDYPEFKDYQNLQNMEDNVKTTSIT
ncbi:tetratricopeptide repeat protein, partial [Candidatus Poribacteria bacterium]|nr:tetratricopeptide repeat protein [Candidatus Poribacteria bacterium]